MAVQIAVQDLLKDELGDVRTLIIEQGQRFDEFAKEIQNFSGKLVTCEQDIVQLRDALAAQHQEREARFSEYQGQMNEEMTTLKARVDRFENDADGMGGLMQMHEKLSKLEILVGDMQPKIDDSNRLVKENTTHTEEFGRKLREFSRRCDEVFARVTAAETRMANTEGLAATVDSAQQALEDSVTKKYEVLWEDVLRAIEEVKGSQLKAMQDDLDQQKESTKIETRSMVNYALNLLSQAHSERRQMALNKSLVTAWKEQTWISARRRVGISYLHRLSLRKHRSVFDLLQRRSATNVLCDRLKCQYEDQLADVHRRVQDGDTMLQTQVTKIDGQLDRLNEEQAATESATAKLTKLLHDIELQLKEFVPIKDRLDQHGEALARHDDEHRIHRETDARHEERIERLAKAIQDLVDNINMKNYVTSEEVQEKMRDILLLWNSIKQLDTAKVDKKDVDAFAVEIKVKNQLTTERLDNLQSDFVTQTTESTARLQEKWNQVDGALDESSRKISHWEQMWGKLAGYVEDLVTKIQDLQSQVGDDGKLPAATIKPVGRTSSRRSLSLSRAEIPSLPAAVQPAPVQPPTETSDSKQVWLNSARGIIDATIDQATTTAPISSRSKIVRPRSATIRKAHDRAK